MRLRSPLYAQIELTYACNLGCLHCYNEPRLSKPKKEDSPEERYKEIAEQLVKHDIFAVTLTGGEVFEVRDRLYSALNQLSNNNLDLSINSNLTLLTEEDAKRLRDFRTEGVMTSLMSYDPETHDKITSQKDSFKRTLRGIELLQKYEIPVTVNMVVSQHNKSHVYQTGLFVSSLGIEMFSAAQAIPSNSGGLTHLEHALTREDLINYLQNLHKIRQDTKMFVKLTNPVPFCSIWNSHPELRYLVETSTCTGGRTIIQIDPLGNVKPCPMIDTNYGNILEEDLDIIWKRMGEWTDNKYVPKECSLCDLVDSCRGSCRGESERRVGSLSSKNPFSLEPIKLEESYQRNGLKQGTKLRVIPNLRVREENNGYYVLFTRDRYMLVPESTAKFISAINSREGIVIDDKVTSNERALEVITSAYNAGILRKS